jgi:hypothetical protein
MQPYITHIYKELLLWSRRLRMLWGLPRSNELGWWSTHSGKSSPCSSSSSTSCAWISCGSDPVCSSCTATGNSSCDHVWCNCISKHANGASDTVGCYDHDDMICRWTHWDLWHRLEIKPFYKVVNIIHSVTTRTCHLLHSLSSQTPLFLHYLTHSPNISATTLY